MKPNIYKEVKEKVYCRAQNLIAHFCSNLTFSASVAPCLVLLLLIWARFFLSNVWSCSCLQVATAEQFPQKFLAMFIEWSNAVFWKLFQVLFRCRAAETQQWRKRICFKKSVASFRCYFMLLSQGIHGNSIVVCGPQFMIMLIIFNW